MNVIIGAKSDQGRRANNEDQLAVLDVRRHRLNADGVLIVADGMGGRRLGEEAASLAVEAVQEVLLEMLAQTQDPQPDTAEVLTSALRKANARVYEKSRRDEATHGMGTTCVAAVIQDQTLYVAHAGDSRAYVLKNGIMSRITEDHSYVAEQVRAGVITEEGARSSRFRNVITRAIGIEPTLTPDVSHRQIAPGDSLLLCSDGLTNAVSDDDIAQTVNYAPSPQAAVDRLIQSAIRAGGKDNITAVVARFDTGNRTEQMPRSDLFTAVTGREKSNKKQRPADAVAEEGPESSPDTSPGRPIIGGDFRWIAAWAAIVVLLLWSGILLNAMVHQGDRFSAVPPFLAAPNQTADLPTRLKPVNLSTLTYLPPALLYVKPVQGGFLSYDSKDSAVEAVTLDGHAVKLSPDGAVISIAQPPAKLHHDQLPVFPADSDQYAAVDPQGNFYVAQASNKEIVKYSPNFMPLGAIHGLSDPTAIAIAPDGTIYVVDSERLKVIRPAPAH